MRGVRRGNGRIRFSTPSVRHFESIVVMDIDEEGIGLIRGGEGGDTSSSRAGGESSARWRATKLVLGVIAVLAAVALGGHGQGDGTSASRFGFDGLARLGGGIANTNTSSADWTKEEFDWRVVSFVSEDYEDIARRWYHRLSNLGYRSHYLVALDDQVYGKLLKAKLRVLRASGFTLEKGADLSEFWRYRLKYLTEEIERGQNVLLSDLDIVFAHHYEPNVIFSKAGDEEVDIYHSLGAGWPRSAKQRWGFSICMGFSAFRATSATQQILEAALKVCNHQKNCDDQVVINELYMNYLQMSWTTNLEHGERKGISRSTMIPLVVKTLSNLVPRVDMDQLKPIVPDSKQVQCFGHVHHKDGGHWAVAPIIEKDGAAKVAAWKRFHDECFPTSTAALGAQWSH